MDVDTLKCENQNVHKEAILNNAAQSVIMMEIAGIACNFSLSCCENKYLNILNEGLEEVFNMSQNSPLWHSARQFRITGSRCYEIFTYRGMDWESKSNKYFWPKSFSNKYTKHGLKYEGCAREAFISKTKKETIECGMILSPQNKWLGFSPDGVVIEDNKPAALLEIKCLYEGTYILDLKINCMFLDIIYTYNYYSAYQMSLSFSGATATIEDAIHTCSFLLNDNGLYSLKKKHKYYGQVQLGMAMLNLEKCFLFLYSSYDDSSVIVEVDFDYHFIKEVLQKIKANYFSKMLHIICENDL